MPSETDNSGTGFCDAMGTDTMSNESRESPRMPEPIDQTLSDQAKELLGEANSFSLDAEPKDADRTLHPQDTPPDPLPLTVDLDHSPPVGDPLFTLTDLTISARPRPISMGTPPPDLTVKQSVPGYEILEELGRGGMGVVYKARQKGLNRLIALKMILSGAHASDGERERFRREAEAVAQLQHQNIVQIYDIGEVDLCPYLAFEFVEGGSLASQLTGDPWPGKQAASLVESLARAMDYAHQQGIVHRDLKPGNILLANASNAECGIENKSQKSFSSAD